ncbi:sugar ABC transporter substrate-binding protein [Pseudonocardia sp. RS010]|uniref:sugar ABC transporter substrate-binding protein n=1 Tax=Pseudonocardia sp. RS010 TaxID=3385979 RepID=UPI0039A3284E
MQFRESVALRWATAAVVVPLVLLGAGCGGGTSGTTDAGTPAASGAALAGPDTAAATAAGTKAGQAAGAPVTLPKKTIGILQPVQAAESGATAQASIEAAATAIGWETVACDGQGDPVKIANCANTLLARNVDAIVSIGNEPSIWNAQLRKAEAQKVPVINTSGEVASDPAILGSYAPNNATQSKLLADWMVAKLKTAGDAPTISVNDFPATWAKVRTNAVDTAAGNAQIQVAATATTDPTNIQAGTRKTITDQLVQQPDLKAIWFSFDVAAQSGAQAVQSRFPSQQFPDRPMVLTFGTDSGTLALMRSGAITAVVENNMAPSNWEAIDQLAGYFARNATIAATPDDLQYGGFNLESYRIFTKDDLPASGPVTPGSDYTAFFKAKWSAEYKAS